MLRLWGCVLTLSLLFCCLCPVRRVEFLDGNGKVVLSFPIYLGETFSTEYIHSVQLCPVVDIFCVVGDTIRLQEERTQSTNAGLPTEAPPNGRFRHEGPWYRYIGGGHSFRSFRLRVGDAATGRNVLTLPSHRRIELFDRFAGHVLLLRVR